MGKIHTHYCIYTHCIVFILCIQSQSCDTRSKELTTHVRSCQARWSLWGQCYVIPSVHLWIDYLFSSSISHWQTLTLRPCTAPPFLSPFMHTHTFCSHHCDASGDLVNYICSVFTHSAIHTKEVLASTNTMFLYLSRCSRYLYFCEVYCLCLLITTFLSPKKCKPEIYPSGSSWGFFARQQWGTLNRFCLREAPSTCLLAQQTLMFLLLFFLTLFSFLLCVMCVHLWATMRRSRAAMLS